MTTWTVGTARNSGRPSRADFAKRLTLHVIGSSYLPMAPLWKQLYTRPVRRRPAISGRHSVLSAPRWMAEVEPGRAAAQTGRYERYADCQPDPGAPPPPGRTGLWRPLKSGPGGDRRVWKAPSRPAVQCSALSLCPRRTSPMITSGRCCVRSA